MQIRIAFRVEGNWWVAYLAKSETMDGAKRIGSILMGIVRDHPERKEAFMDLMKLALSDAIEDVTGKIVGVWDEQPAPESERAGRA